MIGDSGVGQKSRLENAEFGGSREEFQAFSAWASDLYSLSYTGEFSNFRASLQSLSMGSRGLLIEWKSAATIECYRSPAHIARGAFDHYQIEMSLAGGYSAQSGRRSATLRVGDIGIFDTTECCHTVKAATDAGHMAHSLVLMVPRDRMAPILRDPDAARGFVIDGDTPFGRLVARHFQSIWRHGPMLTTEESECAMGSLVTLVAGGIDRTIAGEPIARATKQTMLAAINRHIESQLGSSDLTADSLCRQFGLSRATLSRLFESEGGLGHHIQQRRLHRGFVMLCSPAYRHWRIIDIALECNFSSDATFIRAFRQMFGVTPGEVRAGLNLDAKAGRSAGAGPEGGLLSWLRRVHVPASRGPEAPSA